MGLGGFYNNHRDRFIDPKELTMASFLATFWMFPDYGKLKSYKGMKNAE